MQPQLQEGAAVTVCGAQLNTRYRCAGTTLALTTCPRLRCWRQQPTPTRYRSLSAPRLQLRQPAQGLPAGPVLLASLWGGTPWPRSLCCRGCV
jgi:hypothetical protein